MSSWKTTSDAIGRLGQALEQFDAHHRVATGLIAAAVMFACTLGRLNPEAQTILCWDAFALALLIMSWAKMLFSDAAAAVKAATLEDSTRSVILMVVLAGAVISLFAVAFMLGSAKELKGAALTFHVVLVAATVVVSWFLTNTVLALHYAHAYYRESDGAPAGASGKSGGLDFPGEGEPSFIDFAYFSFVIGMTFQVSDVQITSPRIRALALVHGILSFAFNTVILSFAINLASSIV